MMTAQQILTYAEPLLVLVAFLAFRKAGLKKRLPVMNAYMVVRLVSIVVVDVVLGLHHFVRISETAQCYAYFFTYWSCYLLTSALIFFVIQEVFSELMRPVQQLRRLGMVAFRWVAVISAVVAFAIAVSAGFSSINTVADRLVYLAQLCLHSVSILELCMLAFLALTVHNLGRSFRSPLFGIGLGFGLQAASEFLMLSLSKWQHSGIWSPANFILQVSITLVLCTWTTYFLLPEPQAEREVTFIPTQSPLLRWNDVAQALGHASPRIAVGSSSGFFLQDVERVVDRVMARNQLPGANSNAKVG